MKKIVFTWMLVLVTALAVHAQSLTGKQWCTVLNDEDGEGIAVALTAAVSVPGTYKRDGNDLNTRFDKGKAQVEVDRKRLVVKNDDDQEIPFYVE